MNRLIIITTTCLVLSACTETPTSNTSAQDTALTALSTGQDSYNRLLEVQVSDLEHAYQVGTPIPITVRITNRGPQGPRDTDGTFRHPTAQLFPHLTVWVEQNSKLTRERIDLPIENRIRIKQGETFERSVDLSKLKILYALGEYDVSIGHENHFVTDLGDWTGTLRSRSQTIVIKMK